MHIHIKHKPQNELSVSRNDKLGAYDRRFMLEIAYLDSVKIKGMELFYYKLHQNLRLFYMALLADSRFGRELDAASDEVLLSRYTLPPLYRFTKQIYNNLSYFFLFRGSKHMKHTMDKRQCYYKEVYYKKYIYIYVCVYLYMYVYMFI